ncbi:pre-mRNA-splicing factor cwc22 [Puccinia graminis f. sp. tritici]|uniref:Pre-mRNA-splicing factor cwc22 n=1 Tax=Puccinia graminis f. sp. tritici TaxID=56615 RepID=A0A5B0N5G5_PUCGR|nr:pre-mRNA-splicing factor cwc22 [Puccinia graminis f. sp. tritici]KAA1094120.1 pre-mRNA-splicing factor cwc22 [Puccinia graminis f. sp. tritici]
MSHSRTPSAERQTKRKRSISPTNENDPPLHRKRRSTSPVERASGQDKRESFERLQVDVPRIYDNDPARRREREEQLRIRLAEQELAGIVKPKPDPKLEMQKMAATRGGGAYIPPARLRAMQAQMEVQDPSSPEYQRIRWDALRKSINGLINKVNVGNIKFIVPELFGENLIRGRGLFARSIMRAQASSLPFTPVFAALVSIINTKLPTVGELIVTRIVSQFRRAYRRNDKVTCVATSTFIAQLVNQQVAHHLLAFEIIILLLEKPTDDSVEIAVGFTKEVGAFLSEAEPKANNSVYERFRSILHEATISKRVQYMIEVLFQVRKDRFKDNLVLPEGLDLVEEDDIITHPIHLDDDLQVQDTLNVFKFDPDYTETEEKYQSIKNEILGVDSDSGSSGSESGSDEESSEEEPDTGIVDGKVTIHDHSETNLINFRRNVYLTIMSSLDFEEAAHKLLKRNIEEGLELELANMVVECCSQERSYAKFYGLLGERFCKLNQTWTMTFDQCFRNYYDTIHRFETNRLRNIARFFGHLLAQDAIPWSVFEVIRMNEDDTTSSSRIFVKIMFQEISEVLGLKRLAERFKDPSMQVWYGGLFPIDNPKNTRFSINYFTSIGLGVLTEEMREHLKRAPQLIMAKRRELDEAEASSDDDDSSSDISSISSTDSSDSDSDSSSSDRSSVSRDRRGARNGRRPRRDSPSPVYRRGASGRHRDSRSPVRRLDSRSPVRRRESRSPVRGRDSRSPVRRRDSRSPVRRRDSRDSRSPVRRRRSPSPVRRRGSPSPVRRRGSPSPVRRRGSPSPVRRRGSPSPVRHRDSPSPVRRRGSPSPVRRRRSPSPARRRGSPPPRRRGSPSPVRRRGSPSPVRHRDSPSPVRRRDSPSPDRRRDSPSPVRRRGSPSPVRRRGSPSPVRRRGSPSPLRRRRSPSPVRRRGSPSPVRRRGSPSPVRRRDSPSPVRRRDSPSPVRRRDSPSPVRRRDSPSPSPVRRRGSPSPVRRRRK